MPLDDIWIEKRSVFWYLYKKHNTKKIKENL